MDLTQFEYRAFEKDDPAALFSQYTPEVLTGVAERLLTGRSVSGQSHESLAHLCADSLTNATLIDRHLRSFDPPTRMLLSLLARTRVGVWRTSDILTFQQIFTQIADSQIITKWLELGLAVPALNKDSLVIEDWLSAGVLIFPQVLQRALLFRDFNPLLETESTARGGQTGDGLEWLLRLAYAWQRLQNSPARVTNSGSLFKKDYQRLQADSVLGSPIMQPHVEAPDLGIFTLQLGLQVGLFQIENDLLKAQPWPEKLTQSAEGVRRTFWTATPAMSNWYPVTGDAIHSQGATFASVTLSLMILLECVAENEWVSLKRLLEWIEKHHPHWHVSPKESPKWIEQALGIWGITLGMVEISPASERGEFLYRLTAAGRACLNCQTWAEPAPSFVHCLVVQPNGEMIVYRQGLTPKLIRELTLFADWKNIGSVCTLELSSESVYRGLESGLTSNEIIRILQSHSTQTLPNNLITSIQQWAGRRERIMVFSSVNILEFNSSEDRDEAFQRGLISVKIGERMGISPEKEIPYQQFRLLGNRDYEAKPQQCITFEEDGITFTVDVHTSDLLLEGELNRFADYLSSTENKRKYRFNPQKLKQANEQGLGRAELEQWFMDRTGHPPTPAARLLSTNHQGMQTTVENLIVVSLPVEVVDGLVQWPESKRLIRERLGKTHLSIAHDQLETFIQLLSNFGMIVTRASS